MNCPHCASNVTKERTKKTSLCYRTFCCSACKRTFNERTGTPFNYLEYPTDIVLLVVLWRLRYKLSLRDLAGMFLERGFEFTHEAVRDWEGRFAPLIADCLRAKRRGQAGPLSSRLRSGQPAGAGGALQRRLGDPSATLRTRWLVGREPAVWLVCCFSPLLDGAKRGPRGGQGAPPRLVT